jgi:hypothetical protein
MDDSEITIQTFQQNFLNIIKTNNECITHTKKLKDCLSTMKDKHTEIGKSNNNKPIFLFCLDSFLYQYKIFTLNLESIRKLWTLHNNRMYSDYYKLYNIIVKFMKNDTKYDTLDLSGNTFPIYKELDQQKEFDINDISNVHEAILRLIKQICISITSCTDEIKNYNSIRKVGFSISNYINTLNYENLITISQNTLYINYMSFFHISQKKHLDSLNQNIKYILSEINENINIDHMYSVVDINDDIIHNNKQNNNIDCSTNTILSNEVLNDNSHFNTNTHQTSHKQQLLFS